MITIFFVDRFVANSTSLYEKIYEIFKEDKKFKIEYIGPKDENVVFSTRKVENGKKIWSYGKFFNDLITFFKKEKPDIVHFSFEWKTYGPLKSNLLFPILLIFTRLLKIKVIITLENLFAIKKNSKWEMIYFPSIKIPYTFMKILEKIFIKIVCFASNKVIVNTQIAKDALIEYYSVQEKKIELTYLGSTSLMNSFNSTKIQKFEKLFSNKKIILFFGVISPRKNQQLAIEAFSSIKNKMEDFVLVIAGKAPEEFKEYEESIKKTVFEHGLNEKVVFLGHVDDDEIDILFKMAHIAMFIYKPMIGATFALTFALYHNTPSIVSNIEIFHEILHQDEAIFVNPNNVSEISTALSKFYEDDKIWFELKEKMKSVSKRFTWEEAAGKHVLIYKNLLNKSV